MIRQTLDINRIRLILTMSLTGSSQRNIARDIGCSPSTVSRYRQRMEAAGIVAAEQLKVLSDSELAKVLFDGTSTVIDSKKYQETRVVVSRKSRITNDYLSPDYESVASRIIDTHVSVQVCYRDYVDECKLQSKLNVSHTIFYKRVREKIKSLLPKDMYMIQNYQFGQAVAIDWCGSRFSLKKDQNPYAVCVFTWAASNYTFACFTPDMTTRSVCNAFAKAVKYFGCMPFIVIIDNAKAMVTKHETGKDPIFNRSFENYMHDCHVSIEANNPYSPSSKQMVELSVRLIQDRVLKRMTENMPWSLEEYDNKLQQFIEDYINNEGFRNNCTGTSRATLFEKYEKPKSSLENRILPKYAQFMGIYVVDKSYTVTIEGVKYSVDYNHIGHSVKVLKDDNLYRIFYGLDLIATHVIAPAGSLPVIKEEHMPEAHKAMYKKKQKYPNAESIITKAHQYGSICEKYCNQVLSNYSFEERKQGLICILNEYEKNPTLDYSILNKTLQTMLSQGSDSWNSEAFKRIYEEEKINSKSNNTSNDNKSSALPEDKSALGFMRYSNTSSPNDVKKLNNGNTELIKENENE